VTRGEANPRYRSLSLDWRQRPFCSSGPLVRETTGGAQETRLRHRLRRLRAPLRIAKEPRVVAILRDLIIDAEKRLEMLEASRSQKA
jgi:hypothetical protein